MLYYEKKAKEKGFRHVIGVDEAGRGPLAGPVVSCAVCLREISFSNRIGDSKTLTPRQRERAFEEIQHKAVTGTGIISATVIDSVNILQATFLAMDLAIRDVLKKLQKQKKKRFLNQKRVFLLIDGNRFQTALPHPYKTIVRGDSKSLSIACASIMAKVIRDQILKMYDKIYPQYGFSRHKGYATYAHRLALKKFGPSLIHRQTFHHSHVT